MTEVFKEISQSILRILTEFHRGVPADEAKTPELLKHIEDQLASVSDTDVSQDGRMQTLEDKYVALADRLSVLENGMQEIDDALTADAAPVEDTGVTAPVDTPVDAQPQGETEFEPSVEVPPVVEVPADDSAASDAQEGETPTIDPTLAPLPDTSDSTEPAADVEPVTGPDPEA